MNGTRDEIRKGAARCTARREGDRDAGSGRPCPLSKHIYAQVVDDSRGVTLFGASDRSEGLAIEGTGKVAKSVALGKLVAERAKAKGITRVVFDRGGFQYHGRIKAVADGARNGGLEF
jgi:large subunit ribosomal protein L18